MITGVFTGCKTNKDSALNADNSMSNLDWDATYVGTIPCADCEGIKTVIELNDDLTFSKKTQYLGKSTDVITESGAFSWNETGSNVILKTENHIQTYFVGETSIILLDTSGDKITGDLANSYMLIKQNAEDLKGKPWKLMEFYGKPIENVSKQPFLMLNTNDNRVSGNTSCNGFGGEYELLEGNRIAFSKMMHTMMACPNMTVESEFMKVLEVVDNYTLVNGILNLNKGRMATMAKFEVDYFVN